MKKHHVQTAKAFGLSFFSIVCAAQIASAETYTMKPKNNYRWSVGSTQGFDKPWADGNDIIIDPLETAHVHVDGTVMPSSITFAQSSIHVALRTGTNARIDWGNALAVIESSNTGIAYVDVAMYGTGGLSLTNNAALTYTGGNTGMLLLQKNNSNLTGGITIEKGFVTPGNANAFGSNTITLKNGGGVAFSDKYEGVISNDIFIDSNGSFRTYQKNATASYIGIFTGNVSGAGKITLGGQNIYDGVYFSGTNSFAGSIDIQYGRMGIGNGGTTGSFENVNAVTLSNANSILSFNRSNDYTFNGTVTGAGKIEQAGTGKTVLTGTNTHTGGIVIAAGTLSVASQGNIGGGTITNSGVLEITSSGSFTNAMAINGTGEYSVGSSTDVSFTGAVSGGNLVKSGAGRLGVSNISGTLGGVNVREGELAIGNSNTAVIGALDGAGTLTKQGEGTLAITGDGSFSGTMNITGGSVNLGNGGETGSISGVANVVMSGAGSSFELNRKGDTSLAVSISGSGAFIKNGADKLTFTGTTATGITTDVNGGTFVNAGNLLGDVSVNGSAVFSAVTEGTAKRVTINNNGTLEAAGGSIENLVFGTTAADSVNVLFNVENTLVGGITTIAGSVYFDITGLGSLSTGGGKAYLFSGFDATGFDLSAYSIAYVRAMPVLGADSGGIFFSYDSYAATTLVWNGTTLNPAWDVNSSDNWLNRDGGGAEKFYQWDAVVFDDSAASKNVRFSGDLTPSTITVNNSSGNTYTFGGAGQITGNAGLTKTGTGELIIENSNTYSGGTAISGGTLTLRNLGGLGSGSISTTGGGVLNFDTSGTFAGISSVSGGTGLNTSVTQGNTITLRDFYLYSGGTLTKGGEGTLKLQDKSWVRGNLNVNAGVVELSDIQNALTDGYIRVAQNAALKLTGAFSHSIDAAITLDGGTLEARTSAATGQVGLHMNGKLQGSGNVSFYSDHEYSGHFGSNAVVALDRNSTIDIQNKTFYTNAGANFSGNQATLNIAAGAYFDFYQNNRAEFGGLTGTGTITASQERSAAGYPGNTLVIGKGGIDGESHTFGGIISAGSHQKNVGTNANSTNAAYTEITLVKVGSGTQIMTGYNMASSTTIEAGTLQFGDGVTDGQSIGAKIVNNSRLVVNNAGDQNFASAISGTGTFVKEGSGVLTLNNQNTYTGDTVINAGTLRLGSTGFDSSKTIMPFGDSITAGSGGSYSSYRGFLYDLLTVAGAGSGTTSFVGTQGDGGLPAGYNYHSGVSGDRIQHQITGGANHQRFEERIAMQPDAMLIHMGVNDINGGITQAQMEANTIQMIREIAAGSPDTVIFLATIVPAYSPYAPSPNAATYAKILAYNDWVRSFAADPGASLQGTQIVLVDLSIDGGFPVSDKYTMLDSLHPSNNGYAWMAAQWYSALLETLGSDESSALPSGTNVKIAAGATLDVNNKLATIASLSGSGNVSLGSGFLTLDTASMTAANHAGIISGTGGLIKTGSGMQELSGDNTFTGGTLVRNGTLKISGNLESSTVIVESDGTLSGGGTVNGTVTIGGTLKMGGDSEALMFKSDVVLADGSKVVVEISGDGLNDFLFFDGGEFRFAGEADFFISNNDAERAEGKIYTLFKGVTASGGIFNEAGIYSFESNDISYELSRDGLLVVTSIVPEPGTYAAVLGALALGFAAYKRRKHF